MGKRIVIALGGNALGSTPYEQLALVTETAKPIVDLIEQGNEVVVVHGNGPQVGMIANAMTEGKEPHHGYEQPHGIRRRPREVRVVVQVNDSFALGPNAVFPGKPEGAAGLVERL